MNHIEDGVIMFCGCTPTPNYSGKPLQPGIHSLHGCIKHDDVINLKNVPGGGRDHDRKEHGDCEDGGRPCLCFGCYTKYEKSGTCHNRGYEDKDMLVIIHDYETTEAVYGNETCRTHTYRLDLVWVEDL
jgi:hypothetical protein